jgi:hypothetical protein
MNTRDLAALGDCDESELTTLVGQFARDCHRLPSYHELIALRRTRSQVGPLTESDHRERVSAPLSRAAATDAGCAPSPQGSACATHGAP